MTSIHTNIINPTIRIGIGVVIALQNKTVSPTTSIQTIEKDTGYYGLNVVTVNAIATDKGWSVT